MSNDDHGEAGASISVKPLEGEVKLAASSGVAQRILGFFGKTQAKANITTAMAERIIEKITNGDFQFDEVERFFFQMLFAKEAKKILNQCAVYRQTHALLESQSLPTYFMLPAAKTADSEPLRETTADWVERFWAYAETVSDSKMQSLYAQIAAGESTRPGSFSLDTLVVLQSLDKHTLAAFERLCQVVLDYAYVLYGHKETEMYLSNNQVGWDTFQHLMSIGLVSSTFSTIESLGWNIHNDFNHPVATIIYNGTTIFIEEVNEDNLRLSLDDSWNSVYLLTRAGCELAKIPEARENVKYFQILLDLLDAKLPHTARIHWAIGAAGYTCYERKK